MNARLHLSLVLATPLAAALMVCQEGVPARNVRLALAPAALEHCRRAAELLYDVTWAAACTARQADDPTDCTLPDNDAARVNAIPQAEEARCLATEAYAARLH